MHSFPGAAITKYHMLPGLKHRNLLSHSSGGHRSKIKVLQSRFLHRPMREEPVPGLSPWLVKEPSEFEQAGIMMGKKLSLLAK